MHQMTPDRQHATKCIINNAKSKDSECQYQSFHFNSTMVKMTSLPLALKLCTAPDDGISVSHMLKILILLGSFYNLDILPNLLYFQLPKDF